MDEKKERKERKKWQKQNVKAKGIGREIRMREKNKRRKRTLETNTPGLRETCLNFHIFNVN